MLQPPCINLRFVLMSQLVIERIACGYRSSTGGVVATLVFELRVDDGYPQDAPASGYTFANVVDRVTVEITNVNNDPSAAAGADQTVGEHSVVTLNSTASSDPDSDTLTYAWAQVGGPTVALTGGTTATPSFTAPFLSAGGADLEFELTVDDGDGGSATDRVVIHVQNINDPPLASAARPTIAVLWPPNHGLVAVGITGVSDPDNNATITITSVTQDEPTNGLGDGDTAIDIVFVLFLCEFQSHVGKVAEANHPLDADGDCLREEDRRLVHGVSFAYRIGRSVG